MTKKNYYGIKERPAQPCNAATIGQAIREIESANLLYGKEAARIIWKMRNTSHVSEQFDETTRLVYDWLEERVDIKNVNSGREPIAAVRHMLERSVFPDLYIGKTHLAVAMHLLGYIVDYADDANYFRANWKWSPLMQHPRRRVEYERALTQDK